MTLSDGTEIVHSDMKPDGRVKVYIEKAVYGGFYNATCYLPDYTWENVVGFSDKEMKYYNDLLHNNVNSITEFAKNGKFENDIKLTERGCVKC
jgi:hypothetical protein